MSIFQDEKLPPTTPPHISHDATSDSPDLDDLDEILDEFAAETPNFQEKEKGEDDPDASNIDFEKAFTKQLQEHMSKLVGNDHNQGADNVGQQDMATILAAMEKSSISDEILNGLGQHNSLRKEGPRDGSLGEHNEVEVGDETFQESLKRTMDRMQASSHGNNISNPDESNLLAQMIEALQNGKEMDDPDDEHLDRMLLGMMEQLTNKDILYEPMRELRDKFPHWIEANRETISAEDLERYLQQQKLAGDIINRFDDPGYLDENSADREFVVAKMQLGARPLTWWGSYSLQKICLTSSLPAYLNEIIEMNGELRLDV